MQAPSSDHQQKSGLFALAIGSVGVVYGNLGSSPLYTMKAIFREHHGLAVNQANVYGAVSLIFWALVLVVCVKYVIFVTRADNRGEGGIMALMALALRGRHRPKHRAVITTLGLIGAALFYGDAVITPAISVLSAAEGLEVAAPRLHDYVIPLSVSVLLGLFLFQSLGTERVGKLFGPIMIAWFFSLAVMGGRSLAQTPEIVRALHPMYGWRLLQTHGWLGFLSLGAVVLAVTGAETLYADLGHFGRKPIRFSWTLFVMPALVLNYLGQGALLLRDPEAAKNPFYLLAPEWALYPLIFLATAATVIASQAVISGAFSITRQAVQLDYLPRMKFVHTSHSEMGQVYAPGVNAFLLIGVLVLMLSFQSSSNLATAYGFAATSVMSIDTALAFIVALDAWKWPWRRAAFFLATFLTLELSFLSANAVKILDGGWLPLLIGLFLYLFMSTWKKGRKALAWHLQRSAVSLTEFLKQIEANPPLRVSGTAIFPYGRHISLPYALLQNVQYNKILHERVILLTVATEDVPYVPACDRLEVENLGQEFYRVTIHYGFKQTPDIPYALGLSGESGLDLDIRETQYYLGRETLIPSDNPALNAWEERIFLFMFRNASNPISFFAIPTERALEIGSLIEI
jgi:KUP system potassium uptake protein